jgi:restriction system protein
LRKVTRGSGPQFVRYFGPVLSALNALGGSARPPEVYEYVARLLNVSEAERSETMSSGQLRFENQVAWARFYLAKTLHIDSSKHGVWTLTDKGRSAVGMNDEQAMEVFHSVQAEFRRTQDPQPNQPEPGVVSAVTEEAPNEPASFTTNHRQELITTLRSLPPSGFERFSQRLLRESGFQEVTITGRSGDGGIDGMGILQINPLVSFKVLFQCKRYTGPVTPSQVRDFRGAMMGRADKGIILTTGSFTGDAKREAIRDGVPEIDLIDGEKLVNMIEQLELGLTPTTGYRVDKAFFDEFMK